MMPLGRACAIAILLGCVAAHAQQAPPPPPPPPPPAGPPSQPPAPAPAPANLSGRVVAADTGSPVRSADIRLAATDQNPNDRNPKASTVVARTDDEGRFELESLPAGSYSLQVAKAGFVSTTFGLSKDQPGIFGLSPGQRISLGDLKLPRGGVIAGRVFDVMGDPVAEVVVTAERLSFLTPAVRRVIRLKSAQTNDLGDFRIHGLTPGKYYVSAARGGTEGRDAPTFFPGVSSISEATPIEVRAGQDSLGVSMQLAPPRFGDVAGIVMNSNGAPFGGANVWLVPSRFDGVQVGAHASAITDAAGRFAINNVSPGDYRLEVFARAWMEKYAVVGDAAGPPPELASVPVSIASGRTEVVSVRTSTGFRVTGQMFVDGVPISAAAGAGVRVTAAAPIASILSGMSIPVTDGVSADGTFVLAGVHGLRFLTTRTPAPGTSYHHTSVGGADVSERGIEVTGNITGVEIHLTTRPTRLEGSVVDATGAAVTDARILLFSTNRNDWLMPGTRRYRDIRVTGQGKFGAVAMPAGNYLAAIVPAEDSDRWADPDYLDSLRGVATAFTITDAATTTITLHVRK